MLMKVEELISVKKRTDLGEDYLTKIQELDTKLTDYFSSKLVVDNNLTRKLVSFQANKTRNHYRWYKFKEAFSAELVEYLITKYKISSGKVLDPFAGAGTTLFACSELGYDSEGIEILPVGQQIIKSGIIARSSNIENLIERLEYWKTSNLWNKKGATKNFEVFRITDGAYPAETEHKIKRFLGDLEKEAPDTREILLLGLLCVIESISYTRKDGQYLRWDYRSGRRRGQHIFNKGHILSFDEAIKQKLTEIIRDISPGYNQKELFPKEVSLEKQGNINLLKESCLDILPTVKSRSYTGIITSPPYCNRYDYTRTYALEHALLGVTESELISLRQKMLSCTVENKKKEMISLNAKWQEAINVCDNLVLLQKLLDYLDYKKEQKELNNNGIARMVRGYFYEMACIIQECYRTLRKHGYMFMVNDNVRYAGASISVDLILSKIAEDLGFTVKNILVLPQGKGNSSQQMGRHGRDVLRKCVYVWEKE
jgi:DNA modification methylase